MLQNETDDALEASLVTTYIFWYIVFTVAHNLSISLISLHLCINFSLLCPPSALTLSLLLSRMSSGHNTMRQYRAALSWNCRQCCWLAIETDGVRFEEKQQHSWRAAEALLKFHIGWTLTFISPAILCVILLCLITSFLEPEM